MIYHCRIKDVDGDIRRVSITLRGMEHTECIIISNLSMAAYHEGYLYAELLDYEKEMERHYAT